MAIYCKFKSAKNYFALPIDGFFVSVANLKEKIFVIKRLGNGPGFVDLIVSNAQTNEEYADDAVLIPKNTSVIVCRVPVLRLNPIVIGQKKTQTLDSKEEDVQQSDSSVKKIPEEIDLDDFGDDIYKIQVLPVVQPSNPLQDPLPLNKVDEDNKIKELIDDSALNWQRQIQEGSVSGGSYGKGFNGGMMGARGFGGRGGFERKAPPPGYICYRCNIPGHLIQHCPTNGDPNYDIKRVKPPTGIPKSMLMPTPDGSYALPNGAVAVLKPNEAAFEKEIEGLPSTTRSINDIPAELRCLICKEVLQDAVLTSKCCFTSFCDKCIRSHIMSKVMCVCGATNILADDLIPNKTVRDTINRLMESKSSSGECSGNMLKVQDMESARPAQPKASSPALSATLKGEQMPPTHNDEKVDVKETTNEAGHVSNAPQQSLEKERSGKIAGVPEATFEPTTVKGPQSQASPPVPDEVVQHNPSASEQGKKKKKKACLPTSGDLQWGGPRGIAAENYMMPFPPSACNPYWGGLQLGMDGFMNPYAGTMPYMGYAPRCTMPVPPPRNLSVFAMPSNPANPVMSKEELEPQKADLERKCEVERQVVRDGSKDQEYGRDVSNTCDIALLKSKHNLMPQQPPSSDDHHHQRHRASKESSPDQSRHHHREERETNSERSRHHYHGHSRRERRAGQDCVPLTEVEPMKLTKKTDYDDTVKAITEAAHSADAEKKRKARALSRIGISDIKKRKLASDNFSNHVNNLDKDPLPSSSSSSRQHHRKSSTRHCEEIYAPSSAVTMSRKNNVALDHEESSDDDERHFKRKKRHTRWESTPATAVDGEEDVLQHSRRSSRKDRLPLTSLGQPLSQVCF